MGRFYFNTENDHSELDPEGTELGNVDEARREAIALLSAMLLDGSGEALWSGKPVKVWVTDEPNGAGRVLFNLKITAHAGENRKV